MKEEPHVVKTKTVMKANKTIDLQSMARSEVKSKPKGKEKQLLLDSYMN